MPQLASPFQSEYYTNLKQFFFSFATYSWQLNDSFMLYNCLQLHSILRVIATLIQAAPGVYKNEIKKI